MAYKYFIYKLNNITGVGGITPPQPVNGDLGLSTYADWYLGRVDETELEYFNKASEFKITPCSADEASGFYFLGVTQVLTDPADPNSVLRDLTASELTLKANAQALIAKMSLRPGVSTGVGDLDDQMADIAKRIALLERCFIYLYKKQLDGTAIPEPWATIMSTFYTDFTTGAIKDPIDIRPDGYQAIYTGLKTKSNDLTNIMATYYTNFM